MSRNSSLTRIRSNFSSPSSANADQATWTRAVACSLFSDRDRSRTILSNTCMAQRNWLTWQVDVPHEARESASDSLSARESLLTSIIAVSCHPWWPVLFFSSSVDADTVTSFMSENEPLTFARVPLTGSNGHRECKLIPEPMMWQVTEIALAQWRENRRMRKWERETCRKAGLSFADVKIDLHEQRNKTYGVKSIGRSARTCAKRKRHPADVWAKNSWFSCNTEWCRSILWCPSNFRSFEWTHCHRVH